ncbi:cytochrome P450 [Actinokineospora xionganensis]|uniref:Cytochrome P450 n=1 Tax=Actinokineospora xionganensis TaxID=2684470 RepID=A0ABR7LEY1_9PSEU|nr:cytochrome P450 [Actinokineospora xionganensis]MBC6451224.1 cytochrome P450 [Actinokineospora xionganensis]
MPQRIQTATGDDAWLVTRHADVRALLADTRLGRSHPDPANAARSSESALFGGPLGDFDTERADHARMRSLMQPHFTPRRMEALRGRVEALTAELLDDLARQPGAADLNQALAVPLPILVICELLGVPYVDRDQFRAWSLAAADTVDRARSEQGLADLYDYGTRLVALKRDEPGDDVITRLCTAEGVTDPEIAGLAMSLLFAGHETTVVQIGFGALLLLTNPDQRQAITDNPDLIPNAVEEMLRARERSVTGIPRYAREDVEIDGTVMRAGDLVLLDLSSANHDPAVFPDPERFDITRRTAAHVSFGHGGHYCVGAPLARMELRAVFSQLVTRFPTMRLAIPLADLRIRQDVLTGGLAELPVAW